MYKEKTKEELIRILEYKDRSIKHLRIVVLDKQRIIRHFRRRIRKIRDSIDYLLEHPHSMDNGMRTNKHPRDRPQHKRP